MSWSLTSSDRIRSISPADILTHSGRPADVLARYERVVPEVRERDCDGSRQELLDLLSKIATDKRNLRVAFDQLEANGGAAPGPNGITYGDLSRETIWPLLRDIGSRLSDGSYRPGPERQVQIPKSSGNGTRTLTLENIEDRIVQRAILHIASPWLEPTFDPHSYGGRPHRGVWMALANALPLMKQGRTILISQDIRNAFDNVPLGRLSNVLRKRIPSPKFIELIENAVLGRRKKGLHQGSPLSPLLMNLYLDHFLDGPWRVRHPGMPLLRYMDDLLILCRPGDDDPAGLHDDLEQLLAPSGMPLKRSREEAICNVAQRPCIWLGYEISRGERGLAIVRPSGWSGELRESLMRAHSEQNSPVRAEQVIRGFTDYAAPCYPSSDRTAVYEAVRDLCAEMAFEEIVPDQQLFQQRWKRAYERWCEFAEQHGYSVRGRKQKKKVRFATRSTTSAQQDDAPF